MAAGLAAAVLLTVASPAAQAPSRFERFATERARASSTPPANRIERLNASLDAGSGALKFEGRGGYLRSALAALQLPIDSQMLVHSRGSFQAPRITERNPRAIFFDDDVQLAWVRGGDVIEVAAQDPALGTVFYSLQQTESKKPRFKRETLCLACHMTRGTRDVPGLVMFTTMLLRGEVVGYTEYMNHATPVKQRFGGWFVTGKILPPAHFGNDVPALAGHSGALASTAGLYDSEGYASGTSDIVALMVFAHKAQTVNSMIRAGWEARMGADAVTLRGAARELVDNLLFIDEARLDGPVRGSSGFAERFAAAGPRDRMGRSLRELDLTRRLMRYPCSYLVHSPTFDALPPPMKSLVYQRLWEVLSGAEKAPRYTAALTLADRRAIVEILRATKPDLPPYFTHPGRL